jgi:hypothetical protein
VLQLVAIADRSVSIGDTCLVELKQRWVVSELTDFDPIKDLYAVMPATLRPKSGVPRRRVIFPHVREDAAKLRDCKVSHPPVC